MTTPAVSLLRKNFPEAEIAYIVDAPYKDLIIGHPDVDTAIVLPGKLGIKDFLKHMRRIRKAGFDVLIDFHGGPRASLLTLFSKAKFKIGYRIKHKHFLYHVSAPREPVAGYMHSVESHAGLTKALGISPASIPAMSLPPAKKQEAEKVRMILAGNKCEGHPVIVIHIGAGNRFREWGKENFIVLMRLFRRHPEIRIFLTGSQEDGRTAESIMEKSGSPLISLTGRLSLMELRELIAASSLFVGGDSGPMHIAATTKTPIVALFGPTLPEHFGPWRAKAVILEKDYACRPCRQRACLYEDFRCMRRITPEAVYKACMSLLHEN